MGLIVCKCMGLIVCVCVCGGGGGGGMFQFEIVAKCQPFRSVFCVLYRADSRSAPSQ